MKAWVTVMVPVLVAGACGDNKQLAPDAARPDARVVDAPPDVPVDAARMVRVFGNVDYGGGLAGVTVSVVGGTQTTTTDGGGDFYFDAAEGSRLVVKAEATNRPELMPMIRGVIAREDLRPRVFYLAGPPEVTAATGLGKTFDPQKAIVEVDFRNATIGGYYATLTGTTGAKTPEFGLVYDDNGDIQLGTTTVTGGSGSTLLLANLVTGDATFAAIVPTAATLPCQPRDANPLPLVAGVVTWFDYECGNAMD